MNEPSMTDIATDRNLWEQYVDPQNNDPEAFDRMSVEEKIALQRDLWPDEADATLVDEHDRQTTNGPR